MPIKCKYCGIDFEAKRKTATYCSAKCRKLAFIKKNSVPDVGVLEEYGVSVPLTVPTIKTCAGCGVEVHPLVCLCTDCVKAGKTHKSLGLTCHSAEAENMEESIIEAQKNIHILETNTLTELKKKGIWLPNWRRTQGETPGKAPG